MLGRSSLCSYCQSGGGQAPEPQGTKPQIFIIDRITQLSLTWIKAILGVDNCVAPGALLAQSGHHAAEFQCPFSGVKRTLRVDRYNSLKLYAGIGTSTRTGNEFKVIGIAWQYRWGGGY